MKLFDRIREHAAANPERAAFIDVQSGHVMSYGDLAEGLKGLPGGGPRSHSSFGVISAGNDTAFAFMVLNALANRETFLALSDKVSESEVDALRWRVSKSVADADATKCNEGVLILPTSGSTARPKLVCRSASSLDAMAAAIATEIGFFDTDRVLATVPLAHSYGLEHGLLGPLWAGSTVLLCDPVDRAAIEKAWAGPPETHPTVCPVVPPVVEVLATCWPVAATVSVRLIYSAGGVLPSELSQRLTDLGAPLIGQVYGSTEIGSVTYRATPRWDGIRGDVGSPFFGVSVEFIEGEVHVQSPWMMKGYLDEPTSLVRGHFPTGDLGVFSADDTLLLQGRAKLVIDTGGGKVSPLEVEAVLGMHPAVAQCVVVPIAQTPTVFRPRAVVVLRGGQSVTAEGLRAWVRDRLAGHKVPRVVEFWDELPMSPAGKVLRDQVARTPVG